MHFFQVDTFKPLALTSSIPTSKSSLQEKTPRATTAPLFPHPPTLCSSPALISFLAVNTFSRVLLVHLPATMQAQWSNPVSRTAPGTQHSADPTNSSSSPSCTSFWQPLVPSPTPARTPTTREGSLPLRSASLHDKGNFPLITLLIVSLEVLDLHHHHCKPHSLMKSKINKSNIFCFNYRYLMSHNETMVRVHERRSFRGGTSAELLVSESLTCSHLLSAGCLSVPRNPSLTHPSLLLATLLFVVVRGLLIVVASLVAERRLSSCGARA